MQEILQINFGQIGNNIGHRYLEKLVYDHFIEQSFEIIKLDNGYIGMSFEEHMTNQFLYRGAFVDFDSKSIDKITTSSQFKFIDPRLLIQRSCSNMSGSFLCSMNIYRNEMKYDFEDAIRKSIEKCDQLDNINYVNAIFDKYCGFALETMKDLVSNYPNQMHSNIIIFPSRKCLHPIEIYNTIFSMHQLIERSNFTLVFDYEGLEQATKKLQDQSNFDNYHDIMAENMLQQNCSSRFPGYNNGSLRKLSTNLISFPRLHFLTCSFTRIKPNEDLFQQIYSLSIPSNSYFTYPYQEFENYYQSQAIIIRSPDKYLEINQFNNRMNNQIEWIPDGILHINCKIPHRFLGDTAMHIGNQRSFGNSLLYLSEAFSLCFRRKAFLHYYTVEGADEMEFTEAESNFNDLITEYVGCQYHDYEYDDEGEEN